MNKKGKDFIKEAKDFEYLPNEFLTLYDEMLIQMEIEYSKANELEIEVQKFKEKALQIERKLKRISGKLNPFFFDERRSYLLRKQKFRLR